MVSTFMITGKLEPCLMSTNPTMLEVTCKMAKEMTMIEKQNSYKVVSQLK